MKLIDEIIRMEQLRLRILYDVKKVVVMETDGSHYWENCLKFDREMNDRLLAQIIDDVAERREEMRLQFGVTLEHRVMEYAVLFTMFAEQQRSTE